MKPRWWLATVLLVLAAAAWVAWWTTRVDSGRNLRLGAKAPEAEPAPVVVEAPAPGQSRVDFSEASAPAPEPAPGPAAGPLEPSERAAQGVERLSQRGGLDDPDMASYPSFGVERDGKRQGLWRTYDEKGVLLSEVTFLDNLREGPAAEWFANGLPLFRGHYSKDKQDGEYESYHPNGQVLSRGQFSLGRKYGAWTQFSAAGAVTSELSYEFGDLHGPCKYYADGKLDPVQSGVYAKGRKIADL
jgi:hypothetical protein